MNPATLKNITYLGDAVYVGHDGYHVWLYTTNGLVVLDKIALEPQVLDAFSRWVVAQPK